VWLCIIARSASSEFCGAPQKAEFEREILRERVKAGIAQARARGQTHGRPPTVKARSAEIKSLFAKGLSKREIAKRLKVGRTSVRRVLTQKDSRP
jgi:putative DNA-invertase from lambdoid prophage Rac